MARSSSAGLLHRSLRVTTRSFSLLLFVHFFFSPFHMCGENLVAFSNTYTWKAVVRCLFSLLSLHLNLCLFVLGKGGHSERKWSSVSPRVKSDEGARESVHSTQTSGPKQTLLVTIQPENPLILPLSSPTLPTAQREQSLACFTKKRSSAHTCKPFGPWRDFWGFRGFPFVPDGSETERSREYVWEPTSKWSVWPTDGSMHVIHLHWFNILTSHTHTHIWFKTENMFDSHSHDHCDDLAHSWWGNCF